MKIGYARVSSTEQNLDRQLVQFNELGVERIFQEKVSGKNLEREELQKALDFVREGDEFYVLSFDRLSRSTKDLLNVMETLDKKKVKLISINENFDNSTSQGKLMITLLGAINEFERQTILERQREGIMLAKQRGVYRGRTKKELENFNEVYQAWKNKEITAVSASKLLNITRQTFYRRVKDYEGNSN